MVSKDLQEFLMNPKDVSFCSVAGMFLMFTGLYVVLWAKKREGYNLLDDDDRVLGIHDTEKPLLS